MLYPNTGAPKKMCSSTKVLRMETFKNKKNRNNKSLHSSVIQFMSIDIDHIHFISCYAQKYCQNLSKNVSAIRKIFPISSHVTSTVTLCISKDVHSIMQTPMRECRITKKSNQTYGVMGSREMFFVKFGRRAPFFLQTLYFYIKSYTQFSRVLHRFHLWYFLKNSCKFSHWGALSMHIFV